MTQAITLEARRSETRLSDEQLSKVAGKINSIFNDPTMNAMHVMFTLEVQGVDMAAVVDGLSAKGVNENFIARCRQVFVPK